MEFLCQHLFIAGLDKASNNSCLIYIYHIRVQALHYLQERDFLPTSVSTSNILLLVEKQLLELIPKVQFRDVGLPFLMATYKLHKIKYKWLKNVANYVFLGPTTIITQTLLLVVVELKAWCKVCSETYKRFGKVLANIYCIDSLFDFMLNLPPTIYCVYMADITRCYVSIPLSSIDNLSDALQFVIKLTFQQHHSIH